jgi:transcriptional regulator with XRE-family HTH domain
MSDKLPNYLRSYRRRVGLSQADVAYLLGCSSGAKVSRYEQFRREPSLRTALAFEIIHGLPVADLFAGVADEVQQDTTRRARHLARRIAARSTNPSLGRKLAALKLIARPHPEEVRYEPLPP